ncbi:MAG: hypothetical protein HQ481_08395 [Alphaproteobacteria bacterium]|nr:hypothetical protein [Alphaproteobacteria bacterium]
MAHKNKVLTSINFEGEGRCVDIFVRPDGTFGFEEFRRDIEDGRGWFPIGFFGDQVFSSEEDARIEARATVPWFGVAMDVRAGPLKPSHRVV